MCVTGGQPGGGHDGDLLAALDLVAAVFVGLDEQRVGDVLDLGVVVWGAFVDGEDAVGSRRRGAAVRWLRRDGSGGRIAGRVLRRLLRYGDGLRGGIGGQEDRGREGCDQHQRGGEGCVAHPHQGLLTAAVPDCGRALGAACVAVMRPRRTAAAGVSTRWPLPCRYNAIDWAVVPSAPRSRRLAGGIAQFACRNYAAAER